MNYFRLKFYVGPVAVKQAAEAIRKSHHVILEGTEHVYVGAFAPSFGDAVDEIIGAVRKNNDGKLCGLHPNDVSEG